MNISTNQYQKYYRGDRFVIYKFCVPVRGHSKSVIVDLQRSKMFSISNAVFELMTKLEGMLLEEIFDVENADSREESVQLINFLIENEIGFIADNSFESKDYGYKEPDIPVHLLLDFENYDYSQNLQFNDDFFLSRFTKCAQIRMFKYSKSFLVETIQYLSSRDVETIEILMDYKYKKSLDLLISKGIRNISRVYFYSSPQNITENHIKNLYTTIHFHTSNISSCKSCGQISPSRFIVNMDFFRESKIKNNCLYGKIAIDVNGFIKNCPSMTKVFGHIKNDKLVCAFENDNFNNLWNLSKDKVLVCQDCEFRYSCSDCRAYLSDPENELSQPLKCGYDPYTGEWSDWTSNPLRKKSIQYYDL